MRDVFSEGKLWLLEHKDMPGNYVVAIDGTGDVYMSFNNRKQAVNEARRQNRLYDLDCRAVGFKVERLKKGGA